MTWSIIARDPHSGAFGVAVASKFFAVGAICPHGEGGVGALSTQALPNPLWGYRGMRLLREGMPAQAVVEHRDRPDRGAEQRQFHVHDARGGIGVHTGARCIDWCGHLCAAGGVGCRQHAGRARRHRRDRASVRDVGGKVIRAPAARRDVRRRGGGRRQARQAVGRAW